MHVSEIRLAGVLGATMLGETYVALVHGGEIEFGVTLFVFLVVVGLVANVMDTVIVRVDVIRSANGCLSAKRPNVGC